MRSRLLLLGLSAVTVGFTGRVLGTPVSASEPAATAFAEPAPAPADNLSVASAPTRSVLVNGALEALSPRVTQSSHSDALRMAFNAYFSYRDTHPGDVKNPYFYFVDYGLDNRTPRGYMFDMERLELVNGPFIVAHGRGSSAGKNSVPMRFSNTPGSASTSLGLYVTQESYGFGGHSGGQHYTSIGLRMQGVSGRFNSTARSRGVVIHGAPYVTPSGAGRSEGCPAMEQSRARKLIPMIANGALVFLFSPNDASWLREDPWANASASE